MLARISGGLALLALLALPSGARAQGDHVPPSPREAVALPVEVGTSPNAFYLSEVAPPRPSGSGGHEPVRPLLLVRVPTATEIRSATHPPAAVRASAVQRGAFYLALANLGEAALGSFAPVVTGSDDDVVNTGTGEILGVPAINPPHALFHLVLGGAGLWASRSDRAAATYVKVSAAALAGLTVAGVVQGAQSDDEIYYVAGMALDDEANLIHGLLAAASVGFAIDF